MEDGPHSNLGDPVPGVTYVKYFTEMGIAEGAEFGTHRSDVMGDIESRITVYPRAGRHALYFGSGMPHRVCRTKHGSVLWDQEQYVFEQERHKSLGAMIEKLGLMKALPRRDETQGNYFSTRPQPQDFGRSNRKKRMPDNRRIDNEGMIEEESHALTVQSTALEPISAIEDAKKRMDLLQKFVREYLVEGEDYGVIPGVEKKMIFKSGVDKLCEVYGLTDDYEEVRSTIDWTENLFDYEFRCILSKNGRVITVGMGSCSSYESKYKNRDALRICPGCKKPTLIKNREEWGGGWRCHEKRGGCGRRFKDDHPDIKDQIVGTVKNPDLADLKNTIIKMAKKRAKSDATLSATRSSGIFTQDDDESEPIASTPRKSDPPQKPPQEIEGAARLAEDDKKKVYQAAGRARVSDNDIRQHIKENYDTEKVLELTRDQANNVIAWLDGIARSEGHSS